MLPLAPIGGRVGEAVVPRLAAVGECMLELRSSDGDSLALGYGGDVFNTALYAARLGLEVSFFSAVGDDHYSHWLMERWRADGLDCQHVREIAGATPALYSIRTDVAGERSFTYWRSASPFRHWLDRGNYAEALAGALAGYDAIYFSGITLAMLNDGAKRRWLDRVDAFRNDGGLVAFDPNYRPVLWASVEEACFWIDQAYARADLVLPSIEDESSLRGEHDPKALLASLATMPADEVVVKRGTSTCIVFHNERRIDLSIEKAPNAIDTTAAGDSFNAGYLQARLTGLSPDQAARRGARLAAEVVQHPGAIIPIEAMP